MYTLFLDTSIWNQLKKDEELGNSLLEAVRHGEMETVISFDVLDELINEKAFNEVRFNHFCKYVDIVCKHKCYCPYNQSMALESVIGRDDNNAIFLPIPGFKNISEAIESISKHESSNIAKLMKSRKRDLDKPMYDWVENIRQMPDSFTAKMRSEYLSNNDWEAEIKHYIGKHVSLLEERLTYEKAPTWWGFYAYKLSISQIAIESVDDQSVATKHMKRNWYDMMIYASAVGTRSDYFATKDKGQLEIAKRASKILPSAPQILSLEEFTNLVVLQN